MTGALSLLLVDDDATLRAVLGEELHARGFDVHTAATGAEGVALAAELVPAVVILDLQLPDMHGQAVLQALREANPGATEVLVLTGHGSFDEAVECVRLGAADFLAKPCPISELELRIEKALERRALHRRAVLLERALTLPETGQGLVGASPAFQQMRALFERAVATDATVLLAGETGVGKTLLARLLHLGSARRTRPFVVVECAALQESLVQSELFGHERGAFTGAVQAKPGLFEVADGGTLLLDEIGELSAATQATLLRVLDDGVLRHVGGTREIRVDVRVLAATHRDLAALVRAGRFREDLFYRLHTLAIVVPPLRARAGDAGLLAASHLARLNARSAATKTLAAETLAALDRHDWPGNVRELHHAVEAAFALCEGAEIQPADLPATVRGQRLPHETRADPADAAALPTLETVEREHVRRVMRATHGHRGRTAQILGISERTLYRMLRDHGLDEG